MLTWHGDCSRQAVIPGNGRNYNERSAKAAGLRHVADDGPGIRRCKSGNAFTYERPQGGLVRDPQTLGRIRALAIPPAWRDVWICPRDDGHLQATGRDARGRKQYRYHPRWREVRDDTKFGRMAAFARALPRIRRRVGRDLALPGLPRAKVLATVVRLLETTLIRVGNEEYARENDSFGLTSGETRRVESGDVNAYLKEITDQDFTSKDFRTWAGTLLAARALGRLGGCASPGQAQRNVARAIEEVALRLGNTRAVCRKCYVHPAVIDGYLAGTLPAAMEEKALVAFLRPSRGRRPARSLASLLQVSLAARRLRATPMTSRGASP
jgi:DNA topoisomerase-1